MTPVILDEINNTTWRYQDFVTKLPQVYTPNANESGQMG